MKRYLTGYQLVYTEQYLMYTKHFPVPMEMFA
jgi:hypothetical protein